MLTFTKTFGVIFLGSPRTELHHKPHEVSKLMLVPQYHYNRSDAERSIYSSVLHEGYRKCLDGNNIL